MQSSPLLRANKRPSSRWRRLIVAVLAVVALCGVALGAYSLWFRSRVIASLPQLDGEAVVGGLGARVTIMRDAFGVPVIRGESRLDVARALGFLHGQERFFQMDITRRHAAGELAELFGSKALSVDMENRIHGLRATARQALARLPEEQRALLDAYVAGVNAGLGQLGARPFEYLVLRSQPRAWLPEDSILVIYSMALDLQTPTGIYERSLGLVRDELGYPVLNFFAPLIAPDDSALDGSSAPLPPIPSARYINLRKPAPGGDGSAGVAMTRSSAATATADRDTEAMPWLGQGSNSMALGGARTASGAAMLENDMHLSLRVPNTWYRASLVWTEAGGGAAVHTVTGVTIPGAPIIVAGSNGRIAWGFTASFADTSDIISLMPAGTEFSADYYMAPGGKILMLEDRAEVIHVRGESEPVTIKVPWSIWGPVIGENLKKQRLVIKWVFHDPAAANYDLLQLETAGTVAEAMSIAHHAGIPAQNLLVADAAGSIGWTVCGFLPKRVGHDGRLPITWAFGDRDWAGFVPVDEIPTVINPAEGRLYTANQRILGGSELAVIGDGGGYAGQRAARIRDLLTQIEKEAVPGDLLRIALDDHAPYLDRWHELLSATLSPESIAQKNARAALRAAAEKWDVSTARAAVDSTSYTIVSKFRKRVMERVLLPVFQRCIDLYPNFDFSRFHTEEPVWAILQQKPMHLLAPDYATWDDLLLAAADDVAREIGKTVASPADAAWGRFNIARIRHPLSAALPSFLGRLLDMPAEELPGDEGVPRVQFPAKGASERFVVSPGREAEGIFHMPSGQSGNPLSPYYRAGHDAWVRGEATPFLPGSAEHTLILKP